MTSGAFLGDGSRKRSLLERFAGHLAAGDLRPEGAIRWTADDGGSFSGCLSHAMTPAGFQEETGIPGALSSVLDRLHAIEHTPSLPAGAAGLEWLSSIEPGVDLSALPTRLAVWLFEDPEMGLLTGVDDADLTRVVADLLAMHRGALEGATPTAAEWAAIRRRLVAFTNDARNREAGVPAALMAAEAIAWPLTDGSSGLVDALRIHANGSIDRVACVAKAEMGWSSKDDEMIQAVFVRRAEGASTKADLELLGRLNDLRTAFDARRGEVVAPYFAHLRELANDAPGGNGS